MSDILFVNPPTPSPAEHIFYGSMSPPLGIGYLAASLREAGFSAAAIDLSLSHDPMGDLRFNLQKESPAIVGFYTLTQNYYTTEALLRETRAILPEAITWVGGPHVSFEVEAALGSGFDIIFLFEAEHTAIEVAQSQFKNEGKLEKIKGIAFLHDNKVIRTPPRPREKQLDRFPFPARDLFSMHLYPRPGTIMTSRGCPNKCIFCCSSTFEGDYRVRSPGNVIREIQEMHETWGINDFYFIDNVFTANPSRAKKIAGMIRALDLPIGWYCVSRVDLVTPGLMKALAEAGCYRIELGVESGNLQVIEALRKKITLDQVHSACDIILSFGMQPMFTFQVGHPNDTPETVEATLSLAASLRERGAGTYLSVTTPYPGTPLFINRDDFGINIETWKWDEFRTSNPVHSTRYLTRNDLRHAIYGDAVSMQQAIREGKIKDPASAPWLRFPKNAPGKI